MSNYLRLLRVKHYLKNLLIFAPLFFGEELFHCGEVYRELFAFIPFCLGTSIVYIINDMQDVEKDRRHPTKCDRPLASGAVSMKKARILLGILIFFTAGFSILAVILKLYPYPAVLWLAAYIFLNLLYSNGLKNIPVMDVAILAAGFLIRLYYGSCVSGISISSWLYLTVLGGALYLGMGKRRNELQNTEAENTREVLKKYNYAFLDKNMYVCVAFTEITYALWAVQNKHQGLMWTVPVVILIFLKYSLDVEAGDSEGNPIDILMSDRVMAILVLVFLIITFFSIYR